MAADVSRSLISGSMAEGRLRIIENGSAMAPLSALAQRVPPTGGVTVPANRPLALSGILSNSKLGAYNESYLGLRSFWSE